MWPRRRAAAGDQARPDWWPPEVDHAQVSGARLAYVDRGRGEPVVFVHGIVASLGFWRYTVPEIALRRRAVALDLPGFGRSDKPDIDYAVPTFAAWLDRFLAARDIARATVVGNSLGGAVAVALAAERPRRVARLVLVNAAGIAPAWQRLLRLPGRLAVGGFRARRPPALVYQVIFRLAFPTRPDLAAYFARQYAVGARGPEYPAFLRTTRRALQGVLRYPVVAAAARVRVPTLVIWGQRDRLLPAWVGRRLARVIPDARLLEYVGSGHCPMLDAPERFNGDLHNFLESTLAG